MGLLQTFAAKYLPKILARSGLISLISFVLCIIYTLYAITDIAVEPTRISENALLPGLVAENFRDMRAMALLEARLRKSLDNQR